MNLCFATNNSNKIKEVESILNFPLLNLNQIGCLEDVPETSNTIEGNSLQKATYVFNKYNVPCFADDTGLEVKALNNEPGVYSARYAGEQRNNIDNINLLLKNLEDKDDKSAQFKTVITLIRSTNEIHQFEGIIKGKIIPNRKGTKGFGYDSIFIPEGYDLTFAEMSSKIKNKISHRAIAIRKLVNFLKDL